MKMDMLRNKLGRSMGHKSGMSQLFVLSWNSFKSLFVSFDIFEHTYIISIISSHCLKISKF